MPRQKGFDGSSMASTTPSGAVADATKPGFEDERDLELVPLGIDDDAFVRRLAIAGGRDVVAAGEQKALGPVERIGDAHRLIDDPDVAAGVQHRLTIVLEFATLDDGDE